MRRSRLNGLLAACAALVALCWLSGCVGGGVDAIRLQDPTEQGTIGSICGTIYTLFDSKIDFAYQAEVSLTQLNSDGSVMDGGHTASTFSTISGSYQFTSVPKGSYRVSATITDPTDDDIELTNTINGVVVRGGIPTLMVNLLLGTPPSLVDFTGTVTQNSAPASGATVTVEVDAPPADQSLESIAVFITTTTDTDGQYTLTVPDNGLSYTLSSHSTTSSLATSPEILPPLTSESRLVDFVLTTVQNPVVTNQVAFVVSATLPDATPSGSLQALITRLAVARQLHASPQQIARLQKLSVGRMAMRAETPMGFIENDLTWDPLSFSDDVQGYRVYRAPAQDEPYTLVGSVFDPFATSFSDNDPALSFDTSTFYTVTSFAANNTISDPSTPVAATPFPIMTGLTPGTLDDSGTTMTGTEATLHWDTVPGAGGYIVLVFRVKPSFNATPDIDLSTSGIAASATSLQLTGLTPGSYWWAVSAYNTSTTGQNPLFATRISFSAYRKITVVP